MRRTRALGVPALAAVLTALGLLTGCAPTAESTAESTRTPTEAAATGAAPPTPHPPTTTESAPQAAAPAATPGVAIAGEGTPPTRVSIPAIDLAEPLLDLGIDDSGRMEVPVDFSTVGWFTGGGMPGGRGPTVIAAHVDSLTGPAAFARLHELTVGAEVAVTTVDGAVLRYSVTEVADFAKAEFPTARVFGATPTDELRLITCGGYFDAGVGHYRDNRVVFAVPVA
ncbi:class F sortase [Planctomonas psychrotolerans]|uniref:class F sortase n=1 Tax=Planctomonas psychrotolerans TaxID=2528712 RepID=UPI00123B5DA7|nr:class F sortase [Planctomonas psychrotolerans]